MFTETAAALSAAKQAYDLLKIIQEGRDAALISNAIGELREKITELQMYNVELAGLYHAEKQLSMQLADKNAKNELFAQQAQDYAIYKTGAGSVVYRSEHGTDAEVKPHYVCAHCYQNKIISILQPSPKITKVFSQDFISAFCPACSSTFVMHEAPLETMGRLSTNLFRLD